MTHPVQLAGRIVVAVTSAVQICWAAGWWYFGRAGRVLFGAVTAVVAVVSIVQGRPLFVLVAVVPPALCVTAIGFLTLGDRERYGESVRQATRLGALLESRPQGLTVSELRERAGLELGVAVALLYRMQCHGWLSRDDGLYVPTPAGLREFRKPQVSL